MKHSLSLSRRHFLKATAAASAAAMSPLYVRATESEKKGLSRPVKIGYLPITDSAPLLLAHANRLYEAEGLTAEQPVLFRSWAQIAEAFIAGQVNVVHLLSPIALWLRYQKKFPAKIVAWNHTNGSAFTVQPGIHSLQDLGGKTIAVPFWYSIHNVVLQLLLKGAGLKPNLKANAEKVGNDEVKLIVLPPPDMLSALASKNIAGFIVAEPFNATAENLKVGRVLRFTGDVWQDHACCVVLLREEDLQQNPEWAQGVVNAVVKAQKWAGLNRAEAAKILSRESGRNYTPHPLAAIDRVLTDRDVDAYVKSGAIRHPEWHEPRIGFQPYPFPSYTEELVQRVKETQVEGDRSFLDALEPSFVAGDLVDDSLVKNALRDLGGPSVFHLDASLTRKEVIAL